MPILKRFWLIVIVAGSVLSFSSCSEDELAPSPQVIEINEATDDRVKAFASLRENSHRLFETDCFIVEGRWCVLM